MLPRLTKFFFAKISKLSLLLERPFNVATAGSILIVIAFRVDGLWFLGCIAMVPLLFLFRQRVPSLKDMFFTGFWFGLDYYVFWAFPILSFNPSLLWSDLQGITAQIISSGKFSSLFLLGGIIWAGGIGLIFFIVAYAMRSSGKFFLLVMPLLWVAWEVIFSWYITFGLVGWSLGKILVSSSWLRQSARIGGLEALSLLLVMTNVLILLAIEHTARHKKVPYGLLGLLALWLIPPLWYGYVTVHWWTQNASPPARVGIFQPGVVRFPEKLPMTATSKFAPYYREISHARLNVLVFPGIISEKPLPRESISVKVLREIFGTLLDIPGLVIVFNAEKMEKNGIIYNTLFAVRQGEIIGTYRKQVLMPISDYTPKGSFNILTPSPSYGDVTAFTGENGLFLSQFAVGALICDEVYVSHIARHNEYLGSKMLVMSSNDSAFESGAIFRETLRMTRLRAVESRQWIARAAKTGISAIIDPAGNVVSQLEKDQTGFLYFP